MTNQQAIRIEPVIKDLVVDAGQKQAFEIFTMRIGLWWPKGHSVCPDGQADVCIEPKTGGRLFERCTNGGELMWGHVLAWTPPRQITLAWRLDADWVYDPDFLTEVTVTFVPEGDRTRVTLEHALLENYGSRAESVRQSISSDGGWPGILKGFAELVSSGD